MYSHLSDDELWVAIVQNTDSMSALLNHQIELEAGLGAPNDPDNRAAVMRANQQKINKCARDYANYTAELRRRYAIAPDEQQEQAAAPDSSKPEPAGYPRRQHLLFAVGQR